MAHAYIECIVEVGSKAVLETVRQAVHLAGGRTTSKLNRADVVIVCAASCRRAPKPRSKPAHLLLLRSVTPSERRAARVRGYVEALLLDLRVLVPRLRKQFERARPVAHLAMTDDGVNINGTPLTLRKQERALVSELHRLKGRWCSRPMLLERAWKAEPTLRTQRVGTTAYNVNKKAREFGLVIEGSDLGWRIPFRAKRTRTRTRTRRRSRR